MIKMPFIPVSQPFIGERAKELVNECLDTGWISSQGTHVGLFEREFAKYVGASFAISVTSGTAALHLALMALEVGPGDEVIVPDLTFAATANAVLLCGARPVLCAVESATWTMDLRDCESLISPKTKAIIPVHLYGNPVDMNALLKLAESREIAIIEDCAESLGATLNEEHMGTFGTVGCYSFFANKLLSTGEGGMLTTNDAQLADRIRVLRDHGMSPEKRYWHEFAGLNYRMTNIQAAIGVAQLELLDEFTSLRTHQELLYKDLLSGVEGIIFKKEVDGAKPVNWLMSLRLVSTDESKNIKTLHQWLRENNVDSRPFFFPLHEQPPYFDNREALKSTNVLSQSGLSLPTFIGLKDEQIEQICQLITRFMTTNI